MSDTVTVCVTPPLPIPVTVIVYEPGATAEATAMVIVEVPEPGMPMNVGLKVTFTPVGRPAADRVTDELKLPETVVVMVDSPLVPSATETEAGEADMLKSGSDFIPASTPISAPFGLPQPVTRS